MPEPTGPLKSMFNCLAARLLDILFAAGDRPQTLEKLCELADSPFDEVEREILKLVRSGVVVKKGRFLRDGLEERELPEQRRFTINLGSQVTIALSRLRTSMQEE